MSRRSFPRISQSDLRDHADDARVARVWEKIERDLPAHGVRATSKRSLAVLLIAASFGLFGGGIAVGRALFAEHTNNGPVAVAPSPDRTMTDVLTTGADERTFPLPLGGNITLSPGSNVEVERRGEMVTLRLVAGEASLDAESTRSSAALAIVAGDATLSTQAGSALHVRRNRDDMDVTVSSGTVSISSPAGAQKLERGQRDKVPIHVVTAAQQATPHARTPAVAPVRRPGATQTPGEVVAPAPDWLVAYRSNDHTRALTLLRQTPGGISGAVTSASSAEELMILSDYARKAGDTSAAMSAWRRVYDAFPSSQQAQIAAESLAKSYEDQGKVDEAAKLRAKISMPAREEENLCAQIRLEQKAGRKDEATRLASGYSSKYPNGQCKDEVERILRGEAAIEDAPAPAPSSTPSGSPSSPLP
jgi:hypothetical protein